MTAASSPEPRPCDTCGKPADWAVGICSECAQEEADVEDNRCPGCGSRTWHRSEGCDQ